jgi:L-fuconolactonase
MPAPTIDAHHHLWQYSAAQYPWLNGPLAGLRRDFLPAELQRELAAANVAGTVVVQARQDEAETEWLLSLARETIQIRGVVGWAHIAADDFPDRIRELAQQPGLVGLRHWVQAEPEGFLDGANFNRGIRALHQTGLTYDILITERQLEEATRFVDRHPDQQFVVDHMAKPRIAAGELEPWKTRITELARRPNVCCKISGMITEADPKAWTTEQLLPYLDTVVSAFEPSRLMAGSDWPVCLAGIGYTAWWDLLRNYFANFTEDEQQSIFNGCASRVYRLDSAWRTVTFEESDESPRS